MWYAGRLLDLALSVALIPMTACQSPEEAPACAVRASTALIVNGHAEEQYLGLSSDEQNAIVRLTVWDTARDVVGVCGGVFIGHDWLLTAAHCVNHSADLLWLEFGKDGFAERFTDDIVIHPERDLALLHLQATDHDAGRNESGLNWSLDHQLSIDDKVVIAGRGSGEEGDQREFAVVKVGQIDGDWIQLSDQSLAAACFGDSGSPLLFRAGSGAVIVAGILSRGATSCNGGDKYERVDTAVGWIGSYVLPRQTSPIECLQIGRGGRCFGSLSVWCDSALMELIGEPCQAGYHCGWSKEALGYRCVQEHHDPCSGISSTGTCLGSRALRCVEGELLELDCQECEMRCGVSSETGQAVCITAEEPPQ